MQLQWDLLIGGGGKSPMVNKDQKGIPKSEGHLEKPRLV